MFVVFVDPTNNFYLHGAEVRSGFSFKDTYFEVLDLRKSHQKLEPTCNHNGLL